MHDRYTRWHSFGMREEERFGHYPQPGLDDENAVLAASPDCVNRRRTL